MLTVWELVRKAEAAQENILKRIQDLQAEPDSLSVCEQNEFLNLNPINEVECNNFHSFSQSIVKECSELSGSFHVEKSIAKPQQIILLAFRTKENNLQIALDGQSQIDFVQIIENLEQNIGRKLSARGIEKMLASLKIQVQSLRKTNQSQISGKQSKVDQKSTRKNSIINSAISKGNPIEKSNKQNCFKIGHTNYQNMSKVKKNQVTTLAATKFLDKKGNKY